MASSAVTNSYPKYQSLELNSYDGFVLVSFTQYTTSSNQATVTYRITSDMKSYSTYGIACAKVSDTQYVLFGSTGTVYVGTWSTNSFSYSKSFSSGYSKVSHAIAQNNKVYVTAYNSGYKVLALDSSKLINGTVSATTVDSNIGQYNNIGPISDPTFSCMYINRPSYGPYSITYRRYADNTQQSTNTCYLPQPNFFSNADSRTFVSAPCRTSDGSAFFCVGATGYSGYQYSEDGSTNYQLKLGNYYIYVVDIVNSYIIPVLSENLVVAGGASSFRSYTVWPNIAATPVGDKLLFGVCKAHPTSSTWDTYNLLFEGYLYDPTNQQIVGGTSFSLGNTLEIRPMNIALGSFDDSTAVIGYINYSAKSVTVYAQKLVITEN